MTHAYANLNIRPVINACGIYTDLGGSCLSPSVWAALDEVNREWASIPELLQASGERIAALVGAEAARVAPGASACIALGIAACIAGRRGDLNERLPAGDVERRTVLLQKGHNYKYARCALLAGARLEEVEAGSADQLAAALGPDVAAILHPAHLDGREGTLPIDAVSDLARERGVPILVDAAYLSYPTELIGRWVGSGADLVCFSAKYFYGPNAGGFMAGDAELIEAVAELDFTHFEAGPYLTFGRPFKLDRIAIVGTMLALEEWLEMDHEARWGEYAQRVGALAERLESRTDLRIEQRQFTLDERLADGPVNAVVLDLESPRRAAEVERRLTDGEPRIFCVVVDSRLVFCVETVRPEQDEALADAILASI
ncbi:MAG TPA: DegT/DnrJ/EryC1/StrS family aminotransferase [Solirubrobacterales bacterium]|nr:DegT/DnrJ/EryC1/StrS family aminotransferase [Solirubrobacterales bacterium]